MGRSQGCWAATAPSISAFGSCARVGARRTPRCGGDPLLEAGGRKGVSVSPQPHPLPARFFRWLLSRAVRHWPEDTRAWGIALAAEVDETTDAFQALLWSWGGIML